MPQEQNWQSLRLCHQTPGYQKTVLFSTNAALSVHLPHIPLLKVPARRHSPIPILRIMTSIRIHRSTHHITPSLRLHSHLIILLPQRRREAILLMARARRGQEIDDERPHVEDEDEGDGPFADGGAVVVLLVAEHAEGYDEGYFDEDEGELDPEGVGEDAVLAVADAETLVFGADEDGGDDVAGAVQC